MSAHPPHQVEVVFVRETPVVHTEVCYTLVRYYRQAANMFKVTVHRSPTRTRSRAVAEILTTALVWSQVVRSEPERWHDTTYVWKLPSLPDVDPETGFALLRGVADELARDAAAIASA